MLAIMKKHGVSTPESILLTIVEAAFSKCDKTLKTKGKDHKT